LRGARVSYQRGREILAKLREDKGGFYTPWGEGEEIKGGRE